MASILLVEDDRSIVLSLTEFLNQEGFEVSSVCGQREALMAMKKKRYNLLLLDITLKNGNGYAVCSEVRKKYRIPVISLTASGDEGSVVAGFDLGADDDIAKPFRPRELAARIQNVLCRYRPEGNRLCIGSFMFDMESGRVSRDGQEIVLSALEYRILQIFASNRGQILSRRQLLAAVWDVAGNFVNDNTLSVYIKRLREKIGEDPAHPVIIQTVRGLGHRMN